MEAPILAPLYCFGVASLFVWLYNRTVCDWRESVAKKVAALGLLPASILLGLWAHHAFANDTFLPWAEYTLAGALVTFSLLGLAHSTANFVFDLRDGWRRRTRRIGPHPEDLAVPAAWGLKRLLLTLARPINQATSLEVRQYRCVVDGLAREFHGYRIAHLTDFHVSDSITPAYYRRVVAATEEIAPDLILLGGDYISRARHIPKVAAALTGLRARDGVLAIRGNHDYWTRPGAVAAQLESAGPTLLANEVHVIGRGGASLSILGIESPYLPLSERSMERLRKAPGTRIALVHTPDAFPAAERCGASIALAGHTHGGQVRLPVIGTTLSSTRMGAGFAHGSRWLRGTFCLVSNGVGAFFPLRFLCPPTLLVVELLVRNDLHDALPKEKDHPPQ